MNAHNTPETDRQAVGVIGFYSCATVPAGLARRLERERNQLIDALRTMLAVFCEDGGTTPEACRAAEESARAALKAAEEGRP